MLIGISGKKRAGKDTVAQRLVEQHGFVRYSLADPIREMLYTLDPMIEVIDHYPNAGAEEVTVRSAVDGVGWEVAKSRFPELRRLMQVLGTEVGREMIDPDLWLHLMVDFYDQRAAEGQSVVVPDIRFKNEAEEILLHGGMVIRVERDGLDATDEHPSETALDDWDGFAARIENNGSIEGLWQVVDMIYANSELHLAFANTFLTGEV